MRDRFLGYFEYTSDELRTIWTTGTISFDTNALLSLIDFDQTKRSEIFLLFKEAGDRLWLSHQVVSEFFTHARKRFFAYQLFIDDVIADYKFFIDKASKQWTKYSNYALFDTEKELGHLKEFANDRITALSKLERGHTDSEYQSLLLTISKTFPRIGQQIAPKELNKLYKEAEARFALGIPPGYKDSKTKETPLHVSDEYADTPKATADYIIWFELLRHAAELKKPLVFVTQEKKSDWWLKDVDGSLISPRPELIQEFAAKTQQKILIVNLATFLEETPKFHAQAKKVSAATIDKAREIESQQNTEAESALDFLRRLRALPPGRIQRLKFEREKILEHLSYLRGRRRAFESQLNTMSPLLTRPNPDEALVRSVESLRNDLEFTLGEISELRGRLSSIEAQLEMTQDARPEST